MGWKTHRFRRKGESVELFSANSLFRQLFCAQLRGKDRGVGEIRMDGKPNSSQERPANQGKRRGPGKQIFRTSVDRGEKKGKALEDQNEIGPRERRKNRAHP